MGWSHFVVVAGGPEFLYDVPLALKLDGWLVVGPSIGSPHFVYGYEGGSGLAKDPRVLCFDLLGDFSVAVPVCNSLFHNPSEAVSGGFEDGAVFLAEHKVFEVLQVLGGRCCLYVKG